MQEFKVGQSQEEQQIKVYLNSQDDFILLNQSDARTIERYTALIDWFYKRNESYEKDMDAFAKKYKSKKMIDEDEDGELIIDTDQMLSFAKLRISLCEECCQRLDDLFGAGTMRKYFWAFYEVSDDFIPDEDCLLDFFEEMAPVFTAIFGKRASKMKSQYSKGRKGNHTKSKDELIAEFKEKAADE